MRWFWRGPNRRLQAAKARLARPSQVLYASVQLKDKTQQAGAEEKKSSDLLKELFHMKENQTQEHLTQRGCAVSILASCQGLSG